MLGICWLGVKENSVKGICQLAVKGICELAAKDICWLAVIEMGSISYCQCLDADDLLVLLDFEYFGSSIKPTNSQNGFPFFVQEFKTPSVSSTWCKRVTVVDSDLSHFG